MDGIHYKFLLGPLLLNVFWSSFLCGDESKIQTLPPHVARVLAWFPENTETLVAAQSFPVPSLDDNSKPGREVFDRFIQVTGIADLLGRDGDQIVSELAGRKIVLSLRGGRNFDVVSSFGSLRSEGCSIIVFEKNLNEISEDLPGKLRRISKKLLPELVKAREAVYLEYRDRRASSPV